MAKKKISKTATLDPAPPPVRKWARTRLTLVLAMVAGGGVILSLPFRKDPAATPQVQLPTSQMSSGTIARESRFEQIVPLADAPDRPIPAAIAPTTSLATTDVARITPPVLRSPPSLDSLDLSPELSGTYTDSIAAPPSASRWSANRPLVDEHDSPETSRFSGLEDSKSIHQSRPSLAPSDRSFTPSYFEHVIVDGDTLADLAKRYLGGAERWPEIYEGNREVLTDPDLLPIGATIQIPQP